MENVLHWILASKKDSCLAAIERVNRRFARKGFAPCLVTFTGRSAKSSDGMRIECEIVNMVPSIGGWRVIAQCLHIEGETVVKALRGCEVPEHFRTTGGVCEHCNSNRRRSETYVLRNAEGVTKQVGSTCVADFTGLNDAAKLLHWASFDMAIGACLSDDESAGMGGSANDSVADYLAFVSAAIGAFGWLSKGKADQTDAMPTAAIAYAHMTDKRIPEHERLRPTEADNARAEAAIAWASELHSPENDYLHNLSVVARAGYFTRRTMGIAASMIAAHENMLRKAAEAAQERPSAHVGVVGKRETFQATLRFVSGFETQYGYTTVLTFVDCSGNQLVWKASRTDLSRDDAGKCFAIKATVKRHAEYRGKLQTELSRAVCTPA